MTTWFRLSPAPLLRRTVCGLALTCAGAALAAAPGAWRKHDQNVLKACTAASTLKAPKPLGQPIVFSDDVGQTALLLQGRYPQPHMKNRLGRELCLFERRSGAARVAEADALGR